MNFCNTICFLDFHFWNAKETAEKTKMLQQTHFLFIAHVMCVKLAKKGCQWMIQIEWTPHVYCCLTDQLKNGTIRMYDKNRLDRVLQWKGILKTIISIQSFLFYLFLTRTLFFHSGSVLYAQNCCYLAFAFHFIQILMRIKKS